MRPDIEGERWRCDSCSRIFYDALEQALVRIEANVMEDLVGSMEWGLNAVIAAEDGWYTKY